MVPEGVFFTSGVGKHKHKLQSFELALRNAGIEICNLVSVSSIFPPNCKILPRTKGLGHLRAGEITYCVMARAETNEPNRLIASGVGLAIPASGHNYGYISEYHGHGLRKKDCADLVEDMAATMLATTLGIEFDPDKAYDERKEIYRMSGKIVRTRAEVKTASGDRDGLWTTVISAAVFLDKLNKAKPQQ
jgi:arginine decarboxylase